MPPSGAVSRPGLQGLIKAIFRWRTRPETVTGGVIKLRIVTGGLHMKRRVFLGCVAAATLAAGLSLTACGGTTTGQGAAATASPTHPAASPTATATESPSGSIAGVPFYKPSSLESHTDRTALLSTPDSVSKVNAFYLSELGGHGWTTLSKSTSAYHGNFTIKKSTEGANISVYPSGSGSRINISTYPTH